MPHKHTRRQQDLSTYDLPPDRIARPLSTKPIKAETAQTSTTKSKKAAPKAKGDAAAGGKDARGMKRKREAIANANKDSVSATTKVSHDTPRAFRRLMSLAGGKRVRAGLDTGVVETKKQKKQRVAKEKAAEAAAIAKAGGTDGPDEPEESTTTKAAAESTKTAGAAAAAPEPLTIRPGERLAEFNSRVDAALPLAGLIKKSTPGGAGGKDPLGLAKTYRTRQERKLHKLYDQWREEDIRIKEREAEEQELAEEREAELDETLGVKWRLDFQQGIATKQGGGANGKKKRKAGAAAGGSANNYGAADDDVWAEFNRKRGAATKSTVRAGIHGVVGAPPELTKINSNKFKFAQQKKEGGGQGSAEVAAAIARLSASSAKGVNRRLKPTVSGRISKPGDREALKAARKDVLASYRLSDRRKQK